MTIKRDLKIAQGSLAVGLHYPSSRQVPISHQSISLVETLNMAVDFFWDLQVHRGLPRPQSTLKTRRDKFSRFNLELKKKNPRTIAQV